MAKLSLPQGTTSKLLDIFIQDSSSTVGAGLIGLVYNTASLTAYYYCEGASGTIAISLATMTLGTWAAGGFIVVDAVNMPGVYQIGIPNLALASGASSCVLMLKGAPNMAPVLIEIELTATSNQDGVRGGMTALPNAAAATTGGLPTVDSSNSVKVQSNLKKGAAAGFPFQMLTAAGVATTGLTVTTAISKDDASFASTTNSATELGNGWYWIAFTSTETNCNALVLHATATGVANTDLTIFTTP